MVVEYNTLMGVAAGLALLLVPVLARKLYLRKKVSPEGWALSFGVLGTLLAVLGGHMSMTWPLFNANPPVSILFGEPNMFFGVLLLGAAVFLWARRDVIAAIGGTKSQSDEAYASVVRALQPVSWVLFGLGMILLASAIAFWRFKIVGGAPPTEPITPHLPGQPYTSMTFFTVSYGLAALGCLSAPRAVRDLGSKVAKAAFLAFTISGVFFLLFSTMNYYTHSGDLINEARGTNYKW